MISKSRLGIIISQKAAKEIARRHPEIANDYSRGFYARQIVEEYGLVGKYGITSEYVAIRAVRKALEMLLPKEDLEILATHHHEMNGFRFFVDGIGLFGMNEEEKIKVAKKAGKKGAKKQIKLGIGIHNPEGKSSAGKESARARGFKLWDQEQVEYARTLRKNGKSLSQVAYLVNLRYHNGEDVRTRGSVNSILKRK